MELVIAIVILLLISTCLILFILKYNDYQLKIIKIEEAENNIDILLEKKIELFSRSVPIILNANSKYKKEDILVSVNKIKNMKLNNFEYNDELKKIEGEFCEILDLDKDLMQNESIISIKNELTDIENDLMAAIKFYNENVSLYNCLIKYFPSNVIGFIFKYKSKLFYSEEKEEAFEILKKK